MAFYGFPNIIPRGVGRSKVASGKPLYFRVARLYTILAPLHPLSQSHLQSYAHVPIGNIATLIAFCLLRALRCRWDKRRGRQGSQGGGFSRAYYRHFFVFVCSAGGLRSESSRETHATDTPKTSRAKIAHVITYKIIAT